MPRSPPASKKRTEASRQRKKERRDARECYKRRANDLFSFLESNKLEISNGGDDDDDHGSAFVAHLWTDSLLLDESDIDGSVDDYLMFSNVATAAAAKSTTTTTPRASKARSKSFEYSSPGKKCHNRSYKKRSDSYTEIESEDRSSSEPEKMCKNYFFDGYCHKQMKGKKTHNHHNQQQQSQFHPLVSLASVVNLDKCGKEMMSLSSKAVPGENGSMGMLYHSTFEHDCATSSLLKMIRRALTLNKCYNGSGIAYLVINSDLIYDRHRGGLLTATSTSSNDNDNHQSAQNKHNCSTPSASTLATSLPSILLEHILIYLPDTALASLPRVCRAWHADISHSSPNLWKNLLRRRHWPTPPSPSSPAPSYRSHFRTHYAAARTVRGATSGLSQLLLLANGGTGNATAPSSSSSPRRRRPRAGSHDAVVSNFHATHHPDKGDRCVRLKMWNGDGTRVLAAYRNDCTLRLFSAEEGVSSFSSSSSSLLSSLCGCRQLISVRVVPRASKKSVWVMDDMDADESFVACLCTTGGDRHVVVFFERKSLECAGGVNVRSGWFEDLGEEAKRFCYIEDEFFEYLEVNKDLARSVCSREEGEDFVKEDVVIFSAGQIVSCGNFHFMLVVGIHCFNGFFGNRESRCLCLISAFSGRIIWAGHIPWERNPYGKLNISEVTLANSCMGDENDVTVAMASDAHSSIYFVSIDKGKVSPFQLLPASKNYPLDTMTDWRNYQLMLLTSDIVAVQIDQTQNACHSRLLFYPRNNTAQPTVVKLPQSTIICQVMGNNHIFLITRAYSALIHVPSRQQIEKVCLGKTSKHVSATPVSKQCISLVANTSFIAMGVSWTGIVMAGHVIGECRMKRYVCGEDGGKHRKQGRKKKMWKQSDRIGREGRTITI